MAEFKLSGGKVIVEGGQVEIKCMFMKETCATSDVTNIKFTDPTALMAGKLEIFTKKYGRSPYPFTFTKSKADETRKIYQQLLELIPIAAEPSMNQAVHSGNAVSQGMKKYSVLYLGGDDNNPKKTYNISLEILEDSFEIVTTLNNGFTNISIPYDSVKDFKIVPRTVSSFEGLLGGINSRQLNQDNNIHITYVNSGGQERIIRLEMITGTTVMGQAGKCLELMDYLRVSGILAKLENKSPASPENSVIEQLEQLHSLVEKGILTEDEFNAKKKQLLGL